MKEREVEERGWRQPWRQLFCPGGAPTPFLYVLCPEAAVFRYRPRYNARASFLYSNTYTHRGVHTVEAKRNFEVDIFIQLGEAIHCTYTPAYFALLLNLLKRESFYLGFSLSFIYSIVK